ncbi:MAG: aminotransferase class I/II-fold pyridoxal phosphate-dependent enzyme [Gemmatimonadetes bacterium]|nr:aminotransferase class I/II-fold pyridoxal phosphate-dependent enzyme [Gemmatimonadota bacterium]
MNAPPVDLRSDTVTRPTAAMREAIARAEVDDDTLGHDPTVARLEETVAGILGKEAALFFPTGTMANETALALLAPRGTEAIVEATSHFFDWEMGGPAALAGVQLRAVPAADGLLTAEIIAAAIRPPSHLQVQTSVVSVENTHNAAGGRILPIDAMKAIRALADQHGLPVHLDGARLWNASAATRTPEAEFAALAETVMVTLSKGLGCPIGSLLAADRDLIRAARGVRRRLGGSMRQVGILAAAGLYALEHHRDRLVEDHARARRLAELAHGLPGVSVIPPETNIVMMDLRRPGLDAEHALAQLARHGLLMSGFTRTRIRAVTHLDIGDAAIQRAGRALEAVFG